MNIFDLPKINLNNDSDLIVKINEYVEKSTSRKVLQNVAIGTNSSK